MGSPLRSGWMGASAEAAASGVHAGEASQEERSTQRVLEGDRPSLAFGWAPLRSPRPLAAAGGDPVHEGPLSMESRLLSSWVSGVGGGWCRRPGLVRTEASAEARPAPGMFVNTKQSPSVCLRVLVYLSDCFLVDGAKVNSRLGLSWGAHFPANGLGLPGPSLPFGAWFPGQPLSRPSAGVLSCVTRLDLARVAAAPGPL